MKKEYRIFFIAILILGYALVFLLFWRSEQLLQNPLKYCAEQIGEDSVCVCSAKGNVRIVFTKDSLSVDNPYLEPEFSLGE